MAVTIKDVAQEAEVSIATVSRYINQSGYVSPDSADKIKKAIKKLGYLAKNSPQSSMQKHLIEVNFPNIENLDLNQFPTFFFHLHNKLSYLYNRYKLDYYQYLKTSKVFYF